MATRHAGTDSTADDQQLDDLAARAAQGDSSAFAALYQQCNSYVRKVALQVVRRPEDAEDVAQSVWSKLAGRLEQYPREVHFTTWLYRVVTNAAIDHARRGQSRRETPLEDAADAQSPADQELALLRQHLREELARALEALRRRHALRAECFELHYLQELPVGEVAARLRLSEGTVKSHLYYSRKLLVTDHPVLLDLYFAVEERLGRRRR
ncbi:MAG: sigma-70 family RNA polymerase sigma factor [Pyrinomonadaceae bacterium]